jgi:hypothetical protein
VAEEHDIREDPKVGEALAELQNYLSDAISPLVVAESLELVIGLPTELVAKEIEIWTAAQYRRQGASIPVSDYLFHAVRKIHLVGEFKLVPSEPLEHFLEDLKSAVVAICPEADRELLRGNLARLGESRTSVTPPVAILHRQIGTEQPLASGETEPPAPLGSPASDQLPGAEEGLRAKRRLAVLLQRLEQQLKRQAGQGKAAAPDEAGLVARMLAQAAATSASAEELGQFREELRLRGLEARMNEVYSLLSQSLPAWDRPPAQGSTAAAGGSGAARAMRRLLALDQDPAEGARQFIAMVEAAIEQINAGGLSRGATMLETARGVLSERRTDTATVQEFLKHAHEKLDQTRLRAAAEDDATHETLARVLSFFPATTPESLLEALGGEEKRERRRYLLSLLETFGPRARSLAWQRLGESVATFGDRDAFLQRNLLHLLRRIPRPDGASMEAEVEAVAALSSPTHPLTLVKEAAAYLGQARHPKAEWALKQRATELEGLLLHPDQSPYKPADLLSALDRVIYALARFGTAEGHRSVVDHALRQNPSLGDSFGRLTYLAGQDMAAEPDTVSRLLTALDAELPRRILGFPVKSSTERAIQVVEALSGTPAQIVRTTLSEIASRYSGSPLGDAAGRVLSGFEAAKAAAEAQPLTLSGDLGVFGLPNLLQHLAQSEACGSLSISDRRGHLLATLVFDCGLLVAARHGRLEGEAAVYQLLERPASATFHFSGRHAVDGQRARQGRDILPLLLEGQRRFDELLLTSTLIPDETTFKAGSVKPTTPHTEPNTAMVQSVWLAAISGATAAECEADHAVDSYRVRRLLARWIEEGALLTR